jgi:MFS family permease
LTSLAIALGILIIYMLGYIFPNDWRLVGGIAALFSVFTLLLVYFIPESPAWLMSRGRSDDARKALAHIRAIPLNGTIESCFSHFPINFHSNASLQNYSRVNH